MVQQAGGHDAVNMKFIEWFVAEKQGAAKAYDFFQPRGAWQQWVKMIWKPFHLLAIGAW